MATLAQRRATFAKSYRNSAKVLIELIKHHVEHGMNNNHNMKELNALYGIMDGRRDQSCFMSCVKAFCNAKFVEDKNDPKKSGFKMPKERVYTLDFDYSEYRSFRSMADAVDDTAKANKAPAAFSAEKTAKALTKKLKEAGADPRELLVELVKAHGDLFKGAAMVVTEGGSIEWKTAADFGFTDESHHEAGTTVEFIRAAS